MIRVLVRDGNGIHDTVRPVREQPRQRRVAEIQDEAVAVPVHRQTAARASQLRKCAELPSTVTCRTRPGCQETWNDRFARPIQ